MYMYIVVPLYYYHKYMYSVYFIIINIIVSVGVISMNMHSLVSNIRYFQYQISV